MSKDNEEKKSANVNEEGQTPSENQTDNQLEAETTVQEESVPEPKKVEKKIKHPKTDVVRYDDPELDSDWGYAIEFSNSEQLNSVWDKLKSYLETNEHPIHGKVSWLSLDPRGYFSPRLRHFISFTGWGVQIESLPEWFKKNISTISKPTKEIEPSEELADGNWQGYVVKEKIDLTGPEFVKLDNFSRNKRKTLEEAKKPLSSNIPRYWGQKPLFNGRDYLIPVITNEKYSNDELTELSYLEEYLVEQIDWKEPENNKDSFVILPPEFSFDESMKRKINIPEEYTPEFEFDPSMFGGMGGLGGMGLDGMGGMPDFGDMPDLDESDLDDLDEDDSDLNNSLDKTEDENKDSAIDAEVVPEEKP